MDFMYTASTVVPAIMTFIAVCYAIVWKLTVDFDEGLTSQFCGKSPKNESHRHLPSHLKSTNSPGSLPSQVSVGRE